MSSPALFSTPKDRFSRGIGLSLVAFFLFSVMHVFVKMLTDTHHEIEIAFYRNALTLPLFVLYAFGSGKNLDFFKVSRPSYMALRVLIGGIGLILTFAALKSMPLADATVLFLSSTLLTPLIAYFVLQERFGWHRMGAIVLGMVGVILIAGPTGRVGFEGAFIALAAALTHSMVQIMLRVLRDNDPMTITFYFVLGGTLLCSPYMMIAAAPVNFHDAWQLGLVALTGGMAQIFLASSFRYAPASLIAPYANSGLLWAVLFDIALWGIAPAWTLLVGAAMVIGANLYIYHREKVKAAQKQGPYQGEGPSV